MPAAGLGGFFCHLRTGHALSLQGYGVVLLPAARQSIAPDVCGFTEFMDFARRAGDRLAASDDEFLGISIFVKY